MEVTTKNAQTDEFMFRLIEFMASLHDCHNCDHSQTQIYSKTEVYLQSPI